MNCVNHGKIVADGMCVGCGKPFCKECLVDIDGKNYCQKCLNDLLKDSKKKIENLENKNQNQPNVFMNSSSASAASSSSSSGHSLIPNKSKVVAALLAFFLGWAGGHKFYLNRSGQGILYLIFSWTMVPAIISMIEAVLYLCMSDSEFALKYN